MQVLRQVRGPETAEAVFEATALIVGAGFFVAGFVIGLPVFWGHELAISGSGSIGVFAAYGGAITAVIAFALGRVAVRPAQPNPQQARDGFSVPGIGCGGTTSRPSPSPTRRSRIWAGSASRSSSNGASPTLRCSRSPERSWWRSPSH